MNRDVRTEPFARSLIRLLHTARFARALRSFARFLSRSRVHGKKVYVCEINASISYSFSPLCSAPMKKLPLYHSFAFVSNSFFLSISFERTLGRMTMKSTRRVLGHSLVRSLVRSHRSLIRLLRTARFARALRCAHSLARSLTHSLPSSSERGLCQ